MSVSYTPLEYHNGNQLNHMELLIFCFAEIILVNCKYHFLFLLFELVAPTVYLSFLLGSILYRFGALLIISTSYILKSFHNLVLQIHLTSQLSLFCWLFHLLLLRVVKLIVIIGSSLCLLIWLNFQGLNWSCASVHSTNQLSSGIKQSLMFGCGHDLKISLFVVFIYAVRNIV